MRLVPIYIYDSIGNDYNFLLSHLLVLATLLRKFCYAACIRACAEKACLLRRSEVERFNFSCVVHVERIGVLVQRWSVLLCTNWLSRPVQRINHGEWLGQRWLTIRDYFCQGSDDLSMLYASCRILIEVRLTEVEDALRRNIRDVYLCIKVLKRK